MMTFTDDDLKRLKDAVEARGDIGYANISNHLFEALIARLEAAEYFIHVGAELNGVSAQMVEDAEEAWRKAAGK